MSFSLSGRRFLTGHGPMINHWKGPSIIRPPKLAQDSLVQRDDVLIGDLFFAGSFSRALPEHERRRQRHQRGFGFRFGHRRIGHDPRRRRGRQRQLGERRPARLFGVPEGESRRREGPLARPAVEEEEEQVQGGAADVRRRRPRIGHGRGRSLSQRHAQRRRPDPRTQQGTVADVQHGHPSLVQRGRSFGQKRNPQKANRRGFSLIKLIYYSIPNWSNKT